MLAREYSIKEHIASIRTYLKQHRAISHPERLYESPRNGGNFALEPSTNLYAAISNNNSTNFHYIHIRDRREIDLWLFMRYMINLPGAAGKPTPPSVEFRGEDQKSCICRGQN
jgi:hypothetical protein